VKTIGIKPDNKFMMLTKKKTSMLIISIFQKREPINYKGVEEEHKN